MSSSKERLSLCLVLLAYLVVGTLYAFLTPAWQVPDEPAHYNYVRYLAAHRSFPILQQGDYSQSYLEELKSRRFPPSMSVEPVRYEFHQPPLYYLLQTPIFLASGGNLVAMRVFSLFLGGLLLLVIYRMTGDLFPGKPAVAILSTAFVAFIPMHLAMMAGVENDSLAELLLALAVWLSVRQVLALDGFDWRPLARLGVVLGLILVTKTTAYVGVPVAILAVLLRWRRERGSLGRRLAWLLLPPAAISAPWYSRNAMVYGWPDLLGLARHNAVVVGQPRTADWIAVHGMHGYLTRFLEFTFDSFWGVFGWMGVFMDGRVYILLEMATLVVVVGFLLACWQACRRGALKGGRIDAVVLLAFLVLGVLAEYVGYNLTFVQHQGRYLFPALAAIAPAWAVGFLKMVEKPVSRKMALFFLFVAFLFGAIDLALFPINRWIVALALLFSVAFGARSFLPEVLDPLVLAFPCVLLYGLDFYALSLLVASLR